MSPLRTWRGGRTLDEVAALFATTPATLSRLERGETWPDPDLAMRVARISGLSLEQVLIEPRSSSSDEEAA